MSTIKDKLIKREDQVWREIADIQAGIAYRALMLGPMDERLWLQGDEDCGVGLQCRTCDRGGAPIAYHLGGGNGYPEDSDVVNVDSITALFDAGRQHLVERHSA